MKMKGEESRYDKLVDLLRKSKPGLDSSYDIEMNVIDRITESSHEGILLRLTDCLFGWVNIGWVRRSLVLASFLIVLAFILQNNRILKQIEYLSTQITIDRSDAAFARPDALEKRLNLYRLRGKIFRSGAIAIPEEELNRIIDSAEELKTKYQDVMDLIESDPALKRMIKERLKEANRRKIKL